MALNIKAAIKKYHLTSKKVAENMGISHITFSYHVNGNPSVDVLFRIADAIGCHVTELFDPPTDSQDQTDGQGSVVCPHCGKPVCVNLSKPKRKTQEQPSAESSDGDKQSDDLPFKDGEQ